MQTRATWEHFETSSTEFEDNIKHGNVMIRLTWDEYQQEREKQRQRLLKFLDERIV